MLYQPEGQPAPRRHQSLPIRLPQSELNACVETLPLRCTHFDAFRFFAPSARTFNREGQLTRQAQVDTEQPGCVHAHMDLFKWTFKALPYCDASLVPDTLRLALQARILDMRASPYDLSAWSDLAREDRVVGGHTAVGAAGATAGTGDPGPASQADDELAALSTRDLTPIRVETKEGRGIYRGYQRLLYAESQKLRLRLMESYDAFFAQELATPAPRSGDELDSQ